MILGSPATWKDDHKFEHKAIIEAIEESKASLAIRRPLGASRFGAMRCMLRLWNWKQSRLQSR